MLETQRDFVGSLVKAAPGGFAKAISGGNADPSQWATASAAIGKNLNDIQSGIEATEAEKRAVEKEIETRLKTLNELPPVQAHIAVRIEVAAETGGEGNLTISYRIASAGWRPAYDATLATQGFAGAAKLTLVRRAEVTQATGEEWTNVALSLSTAPPASGTQPPALQPSIAALESEYEANADRARAPMAAAPAPMVKSERLEEPVPPPAPSQKVAEAEATADFGGFRAEYKIPGTVSIASGAGARSVRIATEETPVSLEVMAVPKLTDAAYLSAKFKAPAGAPLLGGLASLFRDGAYIGTTEIAFANPGADLTLGFGEDDKVHVERITADRTTGKRGLISSERTDRAPLHHQGGKPARTADHHHRGRPGAGLRNRRHQGQASRRSDRADRRDDRRQARRERLDLPLCRRRKARDPQ